MARGRSEKVIADGAQVFLVEDCLRTGRQESVDRSSTTGVGVEVDASLCQKQSQTKQVGTGCYVFCLPVGAQEVWPVERSEIAPRFRIVPASISATGVDLR